MNKLKFLLAFIALILFSGCSVKSSKFQTYLEPKFQQMNSNLVNNPNIIININKKIELENRCEQIKSSFVPALFYWGWNSELECEFNKETIENHLNKFAKHKAEDLEIEKMLANKTLVINLSDLPTRLKYQDRGDLVYLVFFYVLSQKNYIAPENNMYIGNYYLEHEKIKVFEKEFHIGNALTIQKDIFKTPKKLSWQYADLYIKDLENAVTQIMTEFKNNYKG